MFVWVLNTPLTFTQKKFSSFTKEYLPPCLAGGFFFLSQFSFRVAEEEGTIDSLKNFQTCNLQFFI